MTSTTRTSLDAGSLKGLPHPAVAEAEVSGDGRNRSALAIEGYRFLELFGGEGLSAKLHTLLAEQAKQSAFGQFVPLTQSRGRGASTVFVRNASAGCCV